jgi:hypothetical protein
VGCSRTQASAPGSSGGTDHLVSPEGRRGSGVATRARRKSTDEGCCQPYSCVTPPLAPASSPQSDKVPIGRSALHSAPSAGGSAYVVIRRALGRTGHASLSVREFLDFLTVRVCRWSRFARSQSRVPPHTSIEATGQEPPTSTTRGCHPSHSPPRRETYMTIHKAVGESAVKWSSPNNCLGTRTRQRAFGRTPKSLGAPAPAPSFARGALHRRGWVAAD